MRPLDVAMAYIAAFASGDPDAVADRVTEDFENNQMGVLGSRFRGRDLYRTRLKGFLAQFEGRTGITKLNSTQVFNGMPPVKIQVTALFRAWRDSMKEVEAPFNKLMEWALPIELSKDGSVLARAAETAKGDMGYV